MWERNHEKFENRFILVRGIGLFSTGISGWVSLKSSSRKVIRIHNQGREEACEGIEALTSPGQVKSGMKDRRNEFGDIKMLLKEVKKGRGIVKEDILTVGKGFF